MLKSVWFCRLGGGAPFAEVEFWPCALGGKNCCGQLWGGGGGTGNAPVFVGLVMCSMHHGSQSGCSDSGGGDVSGGGGGGVVQLLVAFLQELSG